MAGVALKSPQKATPAFLLGCPHLAVLYECNKNGVSLGARDWISPRSLPEVDVVKEIWGPASRAKHAKLDSALAHSILDDWIVIEK